MARELSRKGKKVVLCEAGNYNRRLGSTWTLVGSLASKGLTFSKEGVFVTRAQTVGGASLIFAGTATKPPSWMKGRSGVDLEDEVAELYEQIPIEPLADSLIGTGARKIMEAAQHIGLAVLVRVVTMPLTNRQMRSCKPGCGKCMVGCQEGAKWTAREFVEEARKNGAELLVQTRVDRLLTESGRAVGVRAKDPKGWLEIKADTVVLSAGGQGTPPILQRAGIYDAGQGFCVDPLLAVVGLTSGPGSLRDVPMTAGTVLEEDGIVMTDVFYPPPMYMGILAYSGVKGWAYLPKSIHMNRTLGIMVKVKDELDGRVNADGSFSKTLDHKIWARLNKGSLIAEEILLKAGVRRDDLLTTNVSAGHPGGTVRIGELLDENCQTEIKNCYCVDSSFIPDAWGLPPTLVIVAMAMRVARHITGDIRQPISLKTSHPDGCWETGRGCM